jgi:hypothetical protein
MQRRRDGTVTLMAASIPPVEIGEWTWREQDAFSGRRAHTGVSAYGVHRTPDGLRVHGWRQWRPMVLEEGDRLVQYVWLDPQSPPATIAWGARGDARWDFNQRLGEPFDHQKWRREWINLWLAGELTPGTGEITRWSTYLFSEPDGYEKLKAQDPEKAEQKRQRIEDIRDWSAENIMGPDAFTDGGGLPPAGRWVRLEIDAAQVGLVGRQIDGFVFIARGGDAWWDHTALLRDGREIVLCEDAAGFPRDALAEVRFEVSWAEQAAPVRVLFEERELQVEAGGFSDDFRGEDTYGAIGDSTTSRFAYYDAQGRPIYARGTGYNTPNAPAAVHVYELPAPPR